MDKVLALNDPMFTKKVKDMDTGVLFLMLDDTKFQNIVLLKAIVENRSFTQSELNDMLILACKNGSLKAIKYLLEKGVDINNYFNLPLRLIVENDYYEIFTYLIDIGIDMKTHKDYLLRHAKGKILNYLKALA